MFTGLVECTGEIWKGPSPSGEFWIRSPISAELREGQSVAHDGICLTILAIDPKHQAHLVQVGEVTRQRTTVHTWKPGTLVNLERSLVAGKDRLDGHFLLGHVDETIPCISRKEDGNILRLRFQIPPASRKWVVERGSIAIQGVSLTIAEVSAITEPEHWLEVALIPHTLAHTNLNQVSVGTFVNVEYDIIAKYAVQTARFYLLHLQESTFPNPGSRKP